MNNLYFFFERTQKVPFIQTLNHWHETRISLGDIQWKQNEDNLMLGWAITFFIIAIIAAVFGFGGIAGAATGIAQFLFFVFVALLVISLIANALRGKSPKV